MGCSSIRILPVEVENDIPQGLDELVSSRRERFAEMRLKYPKAPPDGFLVFDSDEIENADLVQVRPTPKVTDRATDHLGNATRTSWYE